MSRYDDGGGDDEFAALNYGRWANNARRSLKSPRGRKALAEIREALLALPEKRLIEGALCTVGGPERVPDVTDAEIDAEFAHLKETGAQQAGGYARDELAAWMRGDRDAERRPIAENIERQGCGVCVNGALLWHRLVKQGKSADEAFAALPTVTTWDDGDPLSQTARLAEKDAGIAYTLAWELAYRNDETYSRMTPEDRYTAFLGWINTELGDTEPATAGLSS
jgi:hypothetical protein